MMPSAMMLNCDQFTEKIEISVSFTASQKAVRPSMDRYWKAMLIRTAISTMVEQTANKVPMFDATAPN